MVSQSTADLHWIYVFRGNQDILYIPTNSITFSVESLGYDVTLEIIRDLFQWDENANINLKYPEESLPLVSRTTPKQTGHTEDREPAIYFIAKENS